MRAAAEPANVNMNKMVKPLLERAFTDEGLRKIARRAKCEAVRSNQEGEEKSVNTILREEGAKMLNLLCEKIVIYLEHSGGKIISAEHVNDAFKYLSVKTSTYHAPADNGIFPACETFRARPKAKAAAGAPRAKRGHTAAAEIEHENRDDRDSCVYMERYPFAILVREIVSDYKKDVKISATALSWIQFVVEQHLISILKHTCALVKEISRSSGRVRVAINVKDVRSIINMLKRYVPLMNGTMPDLPEESEEEDEEDEDDDDDDKPPRKKKTSMKGRPKSPKPKAKPKTKAKAKAKAKAKGGSSGKRRSGR